MSNIIYEDKHYNEDVKQQFINEQTKGSREIYNRIFKITRLSELTYDKDLFNFTRAELHILFYVFAPSTKNSSKAYVQYVKKYIDWAIDEGLKIGRVNPLSHVSNAWKEQFVVAPDKRFWTFAELNDMIKSRVNFNDAVIISLLLHGASGKEYAEITNLTIDDINEETNELTLTDDDWTRRKIKVPAECVSLCLRAARDYEYYKSNGTPKDGTKAPIVAMVQNKYVIKASLTKTKNYGQADGTILYRRIATLANDLNVPSISPSQIAQSGMLAYAKDYYLQGKLDPEGYEFIAKQFNIQELPLARMKDEFLNEEEIKLLYNLS